MKKIQEKVIIITGASSGIGLSLAKEFAKHQSKIVIAARSFERLLAIQTELEKIGSEVLSIQTDVSVESDCKRLIDETVRRFGTVDILINNAGISMRALFRDVEISVIKQLMDINFWGAVYCTKYALPYLLKEKGTVVGVSSIAGYIGLPGRTGYSASKYALHGFLQALRVENRKSKLHVLIASPGFTASNIRLSALTENGEKQGGSPRNEEKMMSSEEVAKHIYKAIIKKKNKLILTFIEGKLTVFLSKWLPSFLERMTYNHMEKEDPEFLN